MIMLVKTPGFQKGSPVASRNRSRGDGGGGRGRGREKLAAANFFQNFLAENFSFLHFRPTQSAHFRETQKLITRQSSIWEQDDYDSENSWISDGLTAAELQK